MRTYRHHQDLSRPDTSYMTFAHKQQGQAFLLEWYQQRTQTLRTHISSQSGVSGQAGALSAPTWFAMPISGQPGTFRWISTNCFPSSPYYVPGMQHEYCSTTASPALTNKGSCQPSQPSKSVLTAT
ncbi:hypothetical protein PSPO01_13183, partial [Paraphaeosphaeria sporulosa]